MAAILMQKVFQQEPMAAILANGGHIENVLTFH